MRTELLPPGQNPAEIGAPPQSAEGRNAGGQAGFGEARDLGPGEVGQAGFTESEAEMGGGGDVGQVEDYFKRVGLDKAQGFIAEQQGRNYPDTSSIKLPDGTSISFGEYKKIAVAIQDARAKSDRRPIGEIVREARRPEPPPPEPQPAPRPADWRDALPPEQKNRIGEFEKEIARFDPTQLRLLEQRIKSLQAVAPIDGWQSKKIQEADAGLCLKVIAGKLQSAFPDQVSQLPGERPDPMRNLSEAAKTHVQFLIDKFRKDKNLEKLDFLDLVAYVQAEYKKAGLIGKNAPSWLLPPHLKGELLLVFGLSLEIPLPLEPKEKNART